MSVRECEVIDARDAAGTGRVRALPPPAVRRVRAGLLGCGRVGDAIVTRAARDRDALAAAGLEIEFVAALVRDPARPRAVSAAACCTTAAEFFAARPEIVIEVMGGVEPAGGLVTAALSRGLPVVTANKTLMAERGRELRALAAARGVALAFDAAALAGVPCLGGLARRPFLRAPREVTGILNGTTHFILDALDRGRPFDEALRDAQRLGYAETDSSADISGQDAASKLAIVLQLAGIADVRPGDFPALGIDVISPDVARAARDLSGMLKPLAIARLDAAAGPGAWVGPGFVDAVHPAAGTTGVFNFLELRYSDEVPITFAGPGAGAAVTAATVLDDVAEIANGHAITAPLWAGDLDRTRTGAIDLDRPPHGAWFVHVAGDVTAAALAELLALYHAPAVRAVRTATGAAALTASAQWIDVSAATEVLRAGSGAVVLALPAIGGPYGR